MDGNWLPFLIGSFVGTMLASLLIGVMIFLFFRPAVQWLLGKFMKRLMADRYPENVFEMISAMRKINPQIVLENSLRAGSGQVIERPFGSPRKFLNFDGLVFSPAQLAIFPAPEDADVDLRITIGPKAKKPLTLDLPIMSGAMGYGIGISEKVKIAIAKGTAAAGTLTNTGEGPLLPEERQFAKHLIIQYSSGKWAKEPETLRKADAIEIHFGQGASAGSASFIPAEYIQGRASQIMGVEGEEVVVIPSIHPDVQRAADLPVLVEKLRNLTGGVPIGVKICASAVLEEDMEIAIQAGVDFISIDGGQAGTKGSPPILEDDFGLPTIYALSRAVRYLKERGVKDRITLLSGGGYATPGDCLKALALGADGIYMGTAVVWALTHDQVIKAIPWEPPTELTWYPGKLKDKFDTEEAAGYLENFFASFAEEMEIAILALGKTSIKDVTAADLVALDEWTSKVTQIPLAYEPKAKSETKRTGEEA
ncbi:FMN-binding glutamate synthase family protein [Brevibacillus nitrificans]|uniref:FMN-binding glutamate synthase family protein n=1 Tax=Brevibacillus nitrificans TaxID=651560 RepID=A0A3M8DK23_9BACL|nr:glutamate synthase-related protein [Brevibacillus nitrificans]RNB88393.1 FMN-binding glutamate synthase family protein [Brevibacillus nitrificans]